MSKLLFVILIFAGFFLQAQDDFFLGNVPKEIKPAEITPKIKPGFKSSSSISILDRNSSIFSLSLAPEIKFPVAKKWNLSVGTQVSFSQINGLKPFGPKGKTENLHLLTNSYYIVGDYIVNQNFKIIGGLNYSMNSLRFDSEGKPIHIDNKDMRIGFEYKLRENVRISGEFGVSNGMNPLFYNNNSPFMTNSLFE